jgi:hypothetical protein
LTGDPFHGVITVLGFVDEEVKGSLRLIAPTAVLKDDDIAVLREEPGPFPTYGVPFPIWGALDQDRQALFQNPACLGRMVDIGGQTDPVPRGYPDILLDYDLVRV